MKTQSKTLLMRLGQATVDMGEGTSRNMQICAESAPTVKGIAQVLLNEHLKETQKVALVASLSRHILKLERFFTDGCQSVISFLTNITVESTDNIILKIDTAMEATQGITSHRAVFLKDAALLTQPAARALKLLVWKQNTLQVLHMGMVAEHFSVFGGSDIELPARCTLLQACVGLHTSACTYHPSVKAISMFIETNTKESMDIVSAKRIESY